MKPTPFIVGFAKALMISVDEAKEKWDDFARAIPKKERRRLEKSSENDGYVQGLAYKQWEGE